MVKIKKILFFLLIIGITLAQTTGSIPIIGTSLNVQLAKYSPTPAEAGKVFTVWFKVENRGVESAKDASFILIPEYPFSLPNNDPTRNYGSITGLDDIQLEYKLLVAEETLNGTYDFKMNYTANGRVKFEKEFSVTVQEEQEKYIAFLETLLISIDPPAYANERFNLTIDIVNRDKGTALFTVVKMKTEIGTIERSEIFVGNLKSDDSDSVTFELNLDNVTGKYPVEITTSYKDQDSIEITKTSTIFIDITRKPFVPVEVPVWSTALNVIVLLMVLKWIIIPIIKKLKRHIPRKKR